MKKPQHIPGSQPPSMLAVVIPAYNAAETIGAVIRAIPALVSLIIVVDDGSTDATAEAVGAINDKRVRLLRHKRNQGVGGAMISGYQKALELGADILIKMDSDGQMDAAYLESLAQPVLRGEADYAKGNRFLHRPQLNRMPPLRRIGNLSLSFLAKAASGYWNIFDPTNGYTAIRAEIVRILNTRRIAKRFFFETSLLLELGLLGAVVRDVSIPAVYHNRKSHLSEWGALVEFPPRLAAGLMRRIAYRYFLQDFTAVSLLLFSGLFCLLFGMAFGVYAWAISSRMGVTASTGTVMIAVLPVIIGVQFILQALVLDIQNVPTRVLSENLD